MANKLSYEAERFKMPGLSRYWCYPDGKVQNILTGNFLPLQADKQFYTFDDNYDLSPITPKEIITYYRHLQQVFSRMEATETQTLIYRPYPVTMHAIVDGDGKEVMILNNYLLDIAKTEGIPEHYKIVKY